MITRYQHPSMAAIWNRDAELRRWRQVETEAMRANPLAGDGWLHLKQSERPTPEMVAVVEQRVGHEVVAFLQVWSDLQTDSDARQWLHYGLTSSDVVDTAQSIALAASIEVLTDLCEDLYQVLAGVVNQQLGAQIGRTHGRWAIVRPVGHPWQVAAETLIRLQCRMPDSTTLPGKLSGPVGTARHSWEDEALAALGLVPTEATQIVPRDHLTQFAAVCADLATFCENIATQVRLLSIQGIDEVTEGAAANRIGSSSMPHKRNPILAENICGLARLARAAEAPLRLGLVQWADRDLAHSSVERVALPDLCHLTATCLARTIELVRNLCWHEDRMQWHVDQAYRSGAAYSLERLMEYQRQGLSYLEAHKKVTNELGVWT